MRQREAERILTEGRPAKVASDLLEQHIMSALDPRVRSRLGDFMVFARTATQMYGLDDSASAEDFVKSALALMYYLGMVDSGEHEITPAVTV